MRKLEHRGLKNLFDHLFVVKHVCRVTVDPTNLQYWSCSVINQQFKCFQWDVFWSIHSLFSIKMFIINEGVPQLDLKKKKRNLRFSRWEGIKLTFKHRKYKFSTYMLGSSIIFYLKLNSAPSALRCASPPSHLSFLRCIHPPRLFPGDIVVKNLPAKAGELGSIPGSGRSPGEGNGNPLRYSCPENPMDRGAWQVIVCGVAKSWTWLSDSTTTIQRGVDTRN